MMKSLIPLLVLASAAAGPVDVQKRILNGRPCNNNEGQHYVVLMHHNPQNRFCGGNLISPDWVLTAAHCDEGEFEVLLGAHPSRRGTTVHITLTNERHVYNHRDHCHDIMLLRLPRNRPAGLPTIALPPVGCQSPVAGNDQYTLMGWSFTDHQHRTLPVTLQCGSVRLNAACTGRNQNIVINGDAPYIAEHLLCSVEPNGPYACQSCPGDSGGSLVRNGVLYGVTVAGSAPGTGLTRYMDVCAYRTWIRGVTGI